MDYTGALEIAVIETFETMAFSEVLGKNVLTDFPDWAPEAVWSSIEITRPIKAHLYFATKKQHALDMVSIVSDSDEEEELRSLIEDAVSEYINTIAGRFGANLLTKGEELELGLPVILEPKGSGLGDLKAKVDLIICFEIEDEEVLCALGNN